MRSIIAIAAISCLVQACGQLENATSEPESAPGWTGKALSPSSMLQRKRLIRNVARSVGLNNAAPLAGIGLAETGLAHCWHEARWTCQGPWSADCAGPVVAGAGDGPCSWQEGGLGMFQFDAGTFQETLQRDGRGILSLEGNIRKSVDFVVMMLINSGYVELHTREEALNWLERIETGTEDYRTWIKIVTHRYNGCEPGYCDVYWQRFAHYDKFARAAFEEVPDNFWNGQVNQEVSPNIAPVEVWWHRNNNGRYDFKSLAPDQVETVRYIVDGYLIADNVLRDNPNTATVDNNFPTSYQFSNARLMRSLVAEGVDRRGVLIARGVGSIDVTEGTAVYIRQMGPKTYQIGLERAPENINSIRVKVDGFTLTDAISGESQSERLAVRSSFTQLGAREFEVTGFNEAGVAITRNIRRFVLE